MVSVCVVCVCVVYGEWCVVSVCVCVCGVCVSMCVSMCVCACVYVVMCKFVSGCVCDVW